MLIVAPEEFETPLQAFAAQRTLDGLATSVLTLEDILATGTGRDDAESVKLAIAEQVEAQGLLYVLLAGDADQLPIRYTHNRDFSGSSDWHDIACDLYFADLYHADGSFSDWDGNADDLFGQAPAMGNPNPDGVDFLPDVVLGRIPASTLVELEGYLDKVSAYEASITGTEA